MKKERIDTLLVQRGFFDSREKAKRAIMAGIVHDDYDRIDKPGTKIDIESNIYVKGDVCPYVSRGGLKLEKAIHSFSLDLQDKVMVDVGSSTGGFSDCALQNGVKLIYAVDVGTNQLAWKIRSDDRVIVKEQTNFRYATLELFEQEKPNFATIDVSFISLKLIFPPLESILNSGEEIMALIKPQFEAGREEVGKNGIIKDKAIHKAVIEKAIKYANENHFGIQKLDYSPITGGQGNIEFLGLFKKDYDNENIDIENIVEAAHHSFER